MIVIPARMYAEGLESYADLDRILAHPEMYTGDDSFDELNAINAFAFYTIHLRMFHDLEEKLARVRSVWLNHYNVSSWKQDALKIRENWEYIEYVYDQERKYMEYDAEYSWALLHTRDTGVVIIQDLEDRAHDVFVQDDRFNDYNGPYVNGLQRLHAPLDAPEHVCEWVPALESFFALGENENSKAPMSSPEMEFVSYVHRAAALL